MLAYAAVRGMNYVRTLLRSIDRDVRGQDTLEWILMTGLLAIAITGAVAILGPGIVAGFQAIVECIDLDAVACNVTIP